MNTITLAINLPTGSRNPQEYHNAIYEAIAAATARGDAIGAHALAGLLALMVPLGVHTQGESVSLPFAQGGVVGHNWSQGRVGEQPSEAIWHQAIGRGFRDPHRGSIRICVVSREEPPRCPSCDDNQIYKGCICNVPHEPKKK